ncbi:hypothetical protein H8E77_27960 [bacterium]|nr:hypothetical protein [bacterium]
MNLNKTQRIPPQRMGRVLLLGVILTIANCYWITVAEAMWFAIHITVMSIFFNAVFSLFVLLLVNLGLQKLAPRSALSAPEFLMIYMMMCMGSAISGHGMMQILVPLMGHGFWYASAENDWQNLIWPHIPRWMVVTEKIALRAHYMGESTFYNIEYVKAWILPILAWTGFIFALVWVMLCINMLVRKPWVEQEKLTYPIIQLPMEMIDNSRQFLRNKLLWVGFGIAAGLDLWNELHHVYPNVPGIHLKLNNIGRYFTEKPWNAIGWLPISFYPFAIGLGFFIPLDLLFSCWFFYLFWKGQNVAMNVFGLARRGGSFSGYQGIIEQSSGAYLGLFFLAIWLTRRHLKTVIMRIFGRELLDDSREAMSYRVTVVLMLLGIGFLLGFCVYAGMSLWVAVVFFLIYYMLDTAITRMRAEMGVPVHDMHNGGPDQLLPPMVGTRNLGSRNLTIMTMFWFFNRAHYTDIMPHQLEGFKMAERTGTSNKRLLIAMVVAILISIFATFWAFLHNTYHVGMAGRIEWFGWEPLNRLSSWLHNPSGPEASTPIFLGIGLTFVMFLAFMRTRFLWWPFHPAGYAVSNSWGMATVWFPLFLAWIVKGVILRFGGLKVHQQVRPFFMGLMLGEFVVGSFLSVMGTALGKTVYSFWVY